MKLISKILLFILIVISTPLSSYEFFDNSWMNQIKVKDIEPIEVKNVQRVPQEIVLGMIQVESNGNDEAYNASEDAVGCLQIRPIMVREVNRILKMKGEEYRFKMKDRWDREKSLEMFWIWRDYHHPDSDYEIIARNWNGGPNGYKKKSTERYWEKVNRCLGER
jgi:hypothetical protein